MEKIHPNEVDPQVPLVPEQNENKGKDLECKNLISVCHGEGSLPSDKRQSFQYTKMDTKDARFLPWKNTEN